MNYNISLNCSSFVEASFSIVRYPYEKIKMEWIDMITLSKYEYTDDPRYKRLKTIRIKSVKVPSSFQDIADPSIENYDLKVHKIKMGLRPLGEY